VMWAEVPEERLPTSSRPNVNKSGHLLELAPSSNRSPRGLPGLHRASPSTPLDVVLMCRSI
jgi:hypothetical protein